MYSRTLKLIAAICGVIFFGYLMLIGFALWEFRTHTYTIRNAPNAFTSDSETLQLSKTALRLHGADPQDFTPGTYWGDKTVGHNELNPNRKTTHWISHSPDTPSFGVALEQEGSNVVCYVTRSK